jgi:hypothetical protein
LTSYANVFFDSPAYPLQTVANPTGAYLGWCLDLFDEIFIGQEYTATVVSMLSPNVNTAYNAYYQCQPDNPVYLTYLQGILYIYNQVVDYETVSGYTANDIQCAIWTLLFRPNPLTDAIEDDNGALPHTDANVRAIIADAIAAQTAYNISGNALALLTNDIMGVLILPHSNSGCIQIFSVMIDLCTLNLCTCVGMNDVIKVISPVSTSIPVFPPNGSYNNYTSCIVDLIGSGGGGAGGPGEDAPANSSAGPGGGSGFLHTYIIDLTRITPPLVVNLGAGGIGGTFGVNGGNGTYTTLKDSNNNLLFFTVGGKGAIAFNAAVPNVTAGGNGQYGGGAGGDNSNIGTGEENGFPVAQPPLPSAGGRGGGVSGGAGGVDFGTILGGGGGGSGPAQGVGGAGGSGSGSVAAGSGTEGGGGGGASAGNTGGNGGGGVAVFKFS